MSLPSQHARQAHRRQAIQAGWMLAAATGLIFWLLAQKPYYQALNYTFVIASAFLRGHLGVDVAPSWLNELVPMPGSVYYSVFPLGAVLSVLPLGLFKELGLVTDYPVNLLVGLLAAGCAGLAYAYTGIRHGFSRWHRVLLATWLVGGTWFMTNLLFAGAWQLALGFAVLGQLAALYWSVVRPRPWLAGLGLAVAFGNRTEVILVAPIILAFLLRPYWHGHDHAAIFKQHALRVTLQFAAVPVILGVATLWYNQARFGSPMDFGYARIPGVLDEPWYRQGIFSLSAVGENAHQMLFAGWKSVPGWPYLVPTGWGGSILLASPFLLLLFRRPSGDKLRLIGAWLAILILTFSLWIHGNPGGWQYSYRYAMILLPWFLVLLVEQLRDQPSAWEEALWALSIAISAYATYLFMWTKYLS
jgi:hypothetical protein